MNGGPSQIDLWDYKPELAEQFDKDLPDSIRKGQRITTMTSGQARLPVAPSKFKFQQHGQCGRYVSELLPHTAQIVDELAILKTVHTNAINHDPACTFVMTGNEVPGKPSLGSWLSYGLGSQSDDLPAFVVLTPSWSANAMAQALFTRMWSSGFLPTQYTGVAMRSGADPVLYLKNPDGVVPQDRRAMLDALLNLNKHRFESLHDPEIQTRISQYEMAFRMQSSVPELVEFQEEPAHVLEMYGPEVSKPGTFAASALLARRMVERGVRVVQILHRGWDQHGNIAGDLPAQSRDVDQACAGLIKDLKQRGLLDSTAKGGLPSPTTGAITIRSVSACGWPVEGSKVESNTEKQTISVTTSPRTPSTSTTSTPRYCTAWESTISGSPSHSKALSNA